MKVKIIVLIIALLSLFNAAYAQTGYGIVFPTELDTLRLLPWQTFHHSLRVQEENYDPSTSEATIGAIEIHVRTEDAIGNPIGYPDNPFGFVYYWKTNTETDYTATSIYDHNMWTYRISFGNALLRTRYCGSVTYGNQLSPGDTVKNIYSGSVINENLIINYFQRQRVYIGSDGIRGDTDGNGIVNYNDLDLLLNYVWNDFSVGHYTLEGINYGRCSMFGSSYIGMLDVHLLDIWLADSTDARVCDIGINQLMSGNIIVPEAIDTTLIGNELHVATEGNAVNITTIQENGELWQWQGWVDGETVITIPDPSLEYHIQAVTIPTAVSVVEPKEGELPITATLSQNYPNPFNPTTEIQFSLPQNSNVKIEIYNVTAQLVTTLVNEYKVAGDHSVSWNGNGSPSGAYFYKLSTPDFTQIRKMVLMK
jgi:Secretion system C-terminal sorting domain